MAKRNEFKITNDLQDFTNRFFGDEAKQFESSLTKKIRTKIRLNTIKMDAKKTIERLRKLGVNLTPLSFDPFSFEYSPDTFFPGRTMQHYLGHYYLQDISSMLPAMILNPKPGEKVLDMAAAPGSKTTQMAAMMNNTGTLIANDVDYNRLSVLCYNLDRMGIFNTLVTNKDGAVFGQATPDYFDKILLDAPCSALGVLGNKNEVTLWWNYQKMNKMVHIQQQLLVSAIKALKPGGTMVYSTCTLTPQENEWIVDQALRDYPIEILPVSIPDSLVTHDGIVSIFDQSVSAELKKSKRLYPHENDAQGFFLCLIRKTDSTFSKPNHAKHNKPGKPSPFKIMGSNNPTTQIIHQRFSEYFGINRAIFENLTLLESSDVWMTSADIDLTFSDLSFRQGLRFMRPLSGERFKVTTDALQLFGQHITDNRIDLEDKSVAEKFFSGENVIIGNEQHGQKAVFYDNQCLGAGLAQGTSLKSQIPRVKRMAVEE